MGTSTDAILCFGFPVGGEDEGDAPEWLADEEDADFDEWELRHYGLAYDQNEDRSGDEFWKVRREAMDNCPAQLIIHCSNNYPMYILAIRGTEQTAKRGDIVDLSIDSLHVNEDRISAFKEWCEARGIEYQEPGWMMVSYWG